MKTIKVCITKDASSSPSWEGGFEFPTEEDKQAFFTLVGNGDYARFNSIYVRAYSHFKAWEKLLDLGWHQSDHDGKFLVWNFPETNLEKLELALKEHDWWFDYSDDFRVWSNGMHERSEIQRLMGIVGNPQAKELYDKYSPYLKQTDV